MDRLIEAKGSLQGDEAELGRLVEACEPIRFSSARKQRSLDAIYARNHERRRNARFAMRLAMASVVLLAAGAATAAAFGVRLRAHAAPEVVALALAPAPHHLTHASRPPVVEPATPVEPPEVRTPAPAPIAHHARAVRSQVRSEDPSLVVGALQALRQERDPDRAARLLATYLRTYPRGALAEEATALSIEAADARHNPAATVFAQRYVKEYPHGRFRPTAERVLARASL